MFDKEANQLLWILYVEMTDFTAVSRGQVTFIFGLILYRYVLGAFFIL